jgi:hypothetical protein
MALTLRGRSGIRPMQDGGPLPARVAAEGNMLADDYLVEGEDEPAPPTIVDRLISLGQVVLIIVMAVLSLAVVWTLGVILNIF